MSRFRGLVHVLRCLLRRSTVESELNAELHEHFAHEVERQLSAGVPATEARRRAAARFGNVEALKEAVRDERGGRWLTDLVGDVRIGLRSLRRSPGFVVAVTLSLALGVGGTTAIFSVVNAVLLRPLPYREAGELQMMRVRWGGLAAPFSGSLSFADYLSLREVSAPTAEVATYMPFSQGFTLTTPAGPEVIQGAIVSTEIPRVLGVSPIAGPGFSEDPEATQALIAESLWRRQFGGRQDAIGRNLTLDGFVYTIVGVMPRGFDVPGYHESEAWIRPGRREPTRRGPFFQSVIARLPPSVTPAIAASRLTSAVTPLLRERYGVKAEDRWRYSLTPLKDVVVGEVSRTLLLFQGAALLVLLIAIGNVANLMLARGTVRSRELAVRASLGASRGRLIRQLLTESALLGLTGGALGLGLAFAGLEVGRRSATSLIPRMDEIRLDSPVVCVALGLGLGAGLIAGALPPLRLRFVRLNDMLRDSGRTSSEGERGGRTRRVLVAAEIALTLTVLAGAGLLLRTLGRLEAANPGFEAGGVLTFQLSLANTRYSDPARLPAFFADLEQRLRLPGVTSVAYSTSLPPDRLAMGNNFTLEGRQPGTPGAQDVAEWLWVSREYFTLLRIPLEQGRGFEPDDRPDSPDVAVVSEAFARRHFPDGQALGKRLQGGDWNPRGSWTTIVGVVGDVPYERGVWGGAQPTVYKAYAQNIGAGSPYVSLRITEDPQLLLPSVRRAVLAIDPELPLRDVATMEERLRGSTAEARFRGMLFAILAGLAVMLAATGIYGVIATHVNQRRRETAVRRALGARRSDVLRQVVGSGLRLALAGIVAGLAGALAIARSLSSVLYDVDPRDPTVLAAASLIVAAVAGLACLIPALRAAYVDPMSILRNE